MHLLGFYTLVLFIMFVGVSVNEILEFNMKTMYNITEVKITCGHQSISVHCIGMTDHKYTRSVSVTTRVIFMPTHCAHSLYRHFTCVVTLLLRTKFVI